MNKKIAWLIIVGWIFVCIDIGSVVDLMDDGVGYLFIAIGIFLIDKKDGRLFLSLFLSLFLALTSSPIMKMAYLSSPSWAITFSRCIPPLLSFPLGLHLANYVDKNFSVNSKKKKNSNNTKKNHQKRKAYISLFIAQIAELSCILYFLPIRSSMLVDSFNTESPIRFIPLVIYFTSMIIYIWIFWQSCKQ